MIQRPYLIALWVALASFTYLPAPALAAGAEASTPGKSVIVGPASSKPDSPALYPPPVASSAFPLVYIEGPDPEPVVPARLSPYGEKQAKAHALYSEALRTELRQGFSAALPLYLAITKLDPLFVQAHLKIALFYLQRNQVSQALLYLKNGLNSNPDSADLKAATAYAYRLLKRNDEALALAREVLAATPDQVTAYRVLFEIYSEQGKFDEAMKVVESTVKQNTGKPAFWINLARLYQDLLDEEQRQNPLRSSAKDHQKEVAAKLLPLYEKALAYSSDPSAELLLLLSECQSTLDNKDKALDFARQAHKAAPSNVDIHLRLAGLAYATGHRDEAIKYYEQAFELHPEYGDGWLGSTLAKLYTGAGQLQKATDVLELMISRTPTRVELYNDLAELYERSDRLDKAELNYQQALALDSSTPVPYLQLSYIQLRQKKYAEGDATLLDAQKKFPTSARLCLMQAVSAREQKKFDAALSALAQVKVLATGSDASLLNENYYLELSMTQELAGKKELIEPTLREGLKKFPDNSNMLNALAYFWAEQNRNLDEALKMSKKSIESDPTNGAFLDTLGWIYYQLDQPKEALPLLQQASASTKEDPVVMSHLADTYAKLGQLSEAIDLWQKVAKADPDNKDVKTKLDAALAEAKNTKIKLQHK